MSPMNLRMNQLKTAYFGSVACFVLVYSPVHVSPQNSRG